MPTLLAARQAMATRFEVWLNGPEEPRLRAASDQALDEIERVEARLSAFRAGSDIETINRLGAGEGTRVDPEVFRLLERARGFWQESGGTFDPTVGPLMDYWGFREGSIPSVSATALDSVRSRVGMDQVRLSADTRRVQLLRPGMRLDLGALGKGYALDCAAERLREAGIESALIHAGTSSVVAIGHPPDAAAWEIGVPAPPAAGGPTPGIVARVALIDAALSVSAVWGRWIGTPDSGHGHVIDPRSGHPVRGAWLSAVLSGSAAEADALSTALLVGGDELQRLWRRQRSELGTLLVLATGAEIPWRALVHGAFEACQGPGFRL